MKKLLVLMAAVAAAFAFTQTEARAGDCYRSKVHSRCGHCGNNVLTYYRPIRTVRTRSIYGWVPSWHNNCARAIHGSVYGFRHVYGGSNFRFSYGTPNYHNYGYSAGVSRRSVPAVGVHRTYPSGRTISTYPGFRVSGFSRPCR